MNKLYLTNGRVVLSDRVECDGGVLLEDGVIRAVNPESGAGAPEIDLAGKTLLPGMVDLHCDALEKEVEPRPNVHFPLDFAAAQADKRNAAAGITTAFHAISFAHEELGVRNNQMAAAVVEAVHAWRPHALVDNRVHCRYEITDESGLPLLLQLLAADKVHLFSVMDHTPGQGQFKDIAAYREYVARTYGKSRHEAEAMIRKKLDSAQGAFERIDELSQAARAKGVAVASHDDDSAARVDTLGKLGITLSEFPVNLDAAQAAKARAMHTIFGAPNILRGKSQSGSVRALDAIRAGLADCLCGDYSPAALIAAVVRLPQQADIDLAQAARMVTLNPARAAGLHDRGEIAAGKRADLIALAQISGLPQVSHAWVGGKAVYQAGFDHG